MQAVLVMFRSDGERRSFSIARDVTVIGRREDADLRIPLGDVSRKHARLIREPDGLRLEDLGSSNGTFLNGQRIEVEAMLQAGDSIQVGPVVFVLQVDGYPQDEELNPITSESATAAAMFAGEAAGGALADDDLMGLDPLPADGGGDAGDGEPLAADDLGDDLMGGAELPGGGHELEPAGEFDDLHPLGDDPLTGEGELTEAEVEDAAPADAGPAPVYSPNTISLSDDDEIGAAPAEEPPPARVARPTISLDDDDPLSLAGDDAPAAAGDGPMTLEDDTSAPSTGSEPIPLGDDAAMELLDEDPLAAPPGGADDDLLIDLDEQPGQPKR